MVVLGGLRNFLLKIIYHITHPTLFLMSPKIYTTRLHLLAPSWKVFHYPLFNFHFQLWPYNFAHCDWWDWTSRSCQRICSFWQRWKFELNPSLCWPWLIWIRIFLRWSWSEEPRKTPPPRLKEEIRNQSKMSHNFSPGASKLNYLLS